MPRPKGSKNKSKPAKNVVTLDPTEKEVELSVSEKNVLVPKCKALKVYNNEGVFIREYSEEVQGKDFKDLAKQFCEKNGYKA